MTHQPPNPHAIDLDAVTRTFGDVTAVADLDLTVRRGELYGFLGPNGAGKTTTIGLLLNFLQPTRGNVRLFGHDPRDEEVAVKTRTGALPQGFTPYSRLTGREHLEFVRSVYGVDADLDRFLKRVGLLEAADRNAGAYSHGMTRRLGLAMALVGSPDLLILDEPIAGLDPEGARRVREIIREENERGVTVFVSSHQLTHVEALCDRVGILKDGRLLMQSSIADLRAELDSASSLIVTVETKPVPSSVRARVRAVDGVQDARTTGEKLIVDYSGPDTHAEIISELAESECGIADFEIERASLEDAFAAAIDSNGN
ncbi:ABC transporter ATP-binding protein [Natrinema ejinorense]|uniref:Copper ABC transporter ATP-binding protein n=1 Tax=Natrinema ejinorense TaxID=373386 RepID=A0A2A5QZ47_9EURY|nr:ABC transporter ATP-binding protein [Natrinema ejinorense]PCR92101.1 copper ABC transporter ATP-binding protein [Natrinema ejinorense]